MKHLTIALLVTFTASVIFASEPTVSSTYSTDDVALQETSLENSRKVRFRPVLRDELTFVRISTLAIEAVDVPDWILVYDQQGLMRAVSTYGAIRIGQPCTYPLWSPRVLTAYGTGFDAGRSQVYHVPFIPCTRPRRPCIDLEGDEPCPLRFTPYFLPNLTCIEIKN